MSLKGKKFQNRNKEKKNPRDLTGFITPIEDIMLQNHESLNAVGDCHITDSIISLGIPERSSPDGGETFDYDKLHLGNLKKDCSNLKEVSDDHWSDWEEMLDQPIPEIIGILQVKTPDTEKADTVFSSVCDPPFSPAISQNKNDNFLKENIIKNDKISQQKTSIMQLKCQKDPKLVKPQGLGEEFDIKSLRIEKKTDIERDLFADLMPNFHSKNYSLETMLIEASHKTRQEKKLPSVSETLAELNKVDIEEGDYWNEDNEWISCKENNLLISDQDK